MEPLELPPLECERCGGCCGVVPCTEAEYQVVLVYARDHDVVPLRQDLSCPFWRPAGCAVYPVRPLLCRLMGHTPRLECGRGHDRLDLSTKHADRLMRKYRKRGAPRYLHEACYLRAELVTQLPGLIEE